MILPADPRDKFVFFALLALFSIAGIMIVIDIFMFMRWLDFFQAEIRNAHQIIMH